MLAKESRLKDKVDFNRVQEKGNIYQSTNFGVAYLDRKDSNPSRFGFIVSTKISKDAYDRNRIKRALSEAVRISSVDLRKGFDVVFLAKTSIIRAPTADIMKEVKTALKEIGIYK
jgi:ribonuclease P protein component